MKRHRSCWKHLPFNVSDAQPHAGAAEVESLAAPAKWRATDTESTGLQIRNEQRWQTVHDFLDQGCSLRDVMRRTGLSRATVRRFARTSSAADLDHGRRISRGRALDTHDEFIHQQWANGVTNAAVMLQLLRERGYTGGATTVRDYLRPPRAAQDEGGLTQVFTLQRPKIPSNRQVTRWICTRPEDLSDTETSALADVHQASPHLDSLANHVRDFAVMLTTRTGEHLNDWIRAVQADQHPELHSFVRGLLADYDAVRAGLTLPHSSGPVEGHINRIKTIKRKTYGRAGLDLTPTARHPH